MDRMASVNRLASMAKLGENGKAWYRKANEQVTAAAEILDCSPRYLADMLALFSPRVAVKRSIRFAVRYVRTREFASDVMGSVRASVNHYNATGRIRGPKTKPFADALMGDPEAVVLDVWMAVALGIDQQRFNNQQVRHKADTRIRKVAKRLGWSPSETQAAVWTYAVRRAGRYPAQLTLVTDTLYGPQLENAA